MIDFNDAPKQGTVFEDAEERRLRISNGLKSRIRDFVRYLFPKAIINGQDARIGDISGSKGGSLSIALAPYDTAGRWIDHANAGERGDALSLWARVHNIDLQTDFARVLTECEAWLGGTPPTTAQIRHEVEKAKPVEPEPTRELENIYVYRSVDGEKICEVRRFRLSNGEKDFRPYTNGVPTMPDIRPLYGLEKWKDASQVVVAEGEKCVDALASIGIHATSAMGGANTKLEKTDWTPLKGRELLLWPDNDPAGINFMNKLYAYLVELGHNVRILPIPDAAPLKWDAANAVEEGVNVQSLLATPTTQDTILHEMWSDIVYRYEPELVEDLLPQIGLATLYGPSTVGKSFVALDWSTAIASGDGLFDRDTEPVSILYLAFEGYYGLKKRIAGIKHTRTIDNLNFELVDAPWTLSDPVEWRAFRAFLEGSKKRLDKLGLPLGILIIDTLTAAYAGFDSNAQADVTRAMKQLKRLAMDLKCLVLVIGHTGKDTSRGMVGSFAYKSESDTFIELQAEKDEASGRIINRSVYVEKVKDGRSDYVIQDYELPEIEIGKKPNGKPITTCVVAWKPPIVRAKDQRSASQSAVLKAIYDGFKTASSIGDKLSISRNRMSEILRDLERDGVVSSKMEGKTKFYHLSTPASTDKNEGKQDV